MSVDKLVDLNGSFQNPADIKTAQAFMNFYEYYPVYLNDVLRIFNTTAANNAKATVSKSIASINNPAGKFFGLIGEGIANAAIDLPLPMIGFMYKFDTVNLMSFSHSEFPMANNALVSTNVVKRNNPITLTLLKPITPLNSFLVNSIANDLTMTMLDFYVSRNGTFTIMTPWGNLEPCVLQDLTGIPTSSGTPGVQFKGQFKRVQVVKSQGVGSLSGAIKSIMVGGV